MGNCLTSKGKIVKIVREDGKILEYRALIKVNEVLSEFEGYALTDMLPVRQHMKPNIELVSGRLYYLVPLPIGCSKIVEKKTVRFSEPEEKEGEKTKTSLRIKLVMSKQELKEMLEKGVITMNGIVPEVQTNKGSDFDNKKEMPYSCETWRPSLKSIPEIED